MDLPGPGYIRVLADYFASLPRSVADSRHPAQDLLISSACPAEWAHRDGRIDILRDGPPLQSNSTWLIAHSGRGYSFVLDLSKAFSQGTQVRLSWLDPRDGERVDIASTTVAGLSEFEPPSGGTIAQDWVLILQT